MYVLLTLKIPINNLSGTDGRPIIAKKISVTGRQNGPLLLYRFVSAVISSNSPSREASARAKWTPKLCRLIASVFSKSLSLVYT